MEAQASRTSFLNYSIVCFNGRFGWVPFNDYLITKSKSILELDKENILTNSHNQPEQNNQEDIEINKSRTNNL